jgi:PAS domain S-box-containing protein
MSHLPHSATSLFALLPDAAFIIDTAGTIQHWNPAAARLYGWSADEVLHRAHAAIAPLPTHAALLADRLTSATHQHRDGALLAVHISVQPLVDDAGAPSGALALVRLAPASDTRASDRPPRAVPALPHIDALTRMQGWCTRGGSSYTCVAADVSVRVAAPGSQGKTTWNRLPCPGVLSTATLPP